MITLHTFASGSEGNCALVSAGDTHLLLDAGISCRRIAAALDELGLDPGDLDALLITHEHADHVRGLEVLARRFAVPVYTGAATARQLCYRTAGLEGLIRPVEPGVPLPLGEITVTAFPNSHDAAGPLGYRFDCGGASAGVLTDTGVVTEAARRTLAGVELLVLESNHDVEWLRSGPYPYSLKARILSDRGHLSNDDAAAFAAEMAALGTAQFVLAHLSRQNNTPQQALDTVGAALLGTGAAVTAAPRDTVSRPYAAEGALCRR
ncbi:MAG: MBL fold metallo-hydrolase [Ruminococcaceae bacterium]|nr:MBL fold metallo-hydrolase [Oscillospiraceae bacterium]